MHKSILALVGGSLVFVVASAQAAEISGNVTLATDYVWRGVSQTDEAAAIQGGFDVATDSGLYAGVWGSNIAFSGSVETDYYVGFSNDLNDSFGYDMGVLRYGYPNDPSGANTAFDELYGSVSFKDFTIGVSYSNDFSGETGRATYYSLGYDLSLPNDFVLTLHYGKQNIEDLDDYKDYSISVSKEVAGLELGLGWFDTDISGCDACDSRAVFSISKSM